MIVDPFPTTVHSLRLKRSTRWTLNHGRGAIVSPFLLGISAACRLYRKTTEASAPQWGEGDSASDSIICYGHAVPSYDNPHRVDAWLPPAPAPIGRPSVRPSASSMSPLRPGCLTYATIAAGAGVWETQGQDRMGRLRIARQNARAIVPSCAEGKCETLAG